MKKIISILISIIVFGSILMFLILPKKEFSYNENRYLNYLDKDDSGVPEITENL